MIAAVSSSAFAADVIASQREVFDALAEAWLAQGATAFGLILDGKWAYLKPTTVCDSEMLLRQAVTFRGHVAELQLGGLDESANQARLKADAATLSRLLLLEADLTSMTQDLIDNQEQLLALFELNRSSRLRRNLNEALCEIMREAHRLTQVSAISAYFDLDPAIVIQHPRPSYAVETLQLFLNHLREVNQQVVLTADEHPGILPQPVRAALLEPIAMNGQVIGVVCLFKDRIFQSPELKLARAICDQVEGYIENLVLYRDSLRQERLKTEMLLARDVQVHLLPQTSPTHPGLEIAARSNSAHQVGGDFYDFLMQPGETFSFMIGDVAGKGVPASMLMAMTRTLMRSKARTLYKPQPIDIIESVNNELYDDFTEVGMFATAFLGSYDNREKMLSFANAGQSPVIYRPADGCARLLVADGTALGVLPSCLCANQSLRLADGDLLVASTDGFSEAMNSDGEMFGCERLLGLVDSLAECSASEIVSRLYTAVAAFSDTQHDDQTVVVLKGIGDD